MHLSDFQGNVARQTRGQVLPPDLESVAREIEKLPNDGLTLSGELGSILIGLATVAGRNGLDLEDCAFEAMMTLRQSAGG